MEIEVKSALEPREKIYVELDPQIIRETLTTGRSDRYRGKMKPMYGIVNLSLDQFTSMVEKECEEDSFSVSRSQDGVYCKIVGVDIQAEGSGY